MGRLFDAFATDPEAQKSGNRMGDAFGTNYAAVNSKNPRKSDRVMPATELNMNGLLDAATMIPVVGDALSGGMAVYDAVKGDYPSAAMNALGVLPFIGGAGTIKYGKGFNSESVKDLISSQRYLDRDTVAKKIKANDFTVNVTPEFEIDGEKFRAITDGHHSLEAARISRNEPVFIIDNASTNDKVGLLGRPNDYLEAAYHDSPWYRWIDKKAIRKDVWKLSLHGNMRIRNFVWK